MENKQDISSQKSSHVSSGPRAAGMKISVEGASVYNDQARLERDREFGFINEPSRKQTVSSANVARTHASAAAEATRIEGVARTVEQQTAPAEEPARGFVGRAAGLFRGARNKVQKPAATDSSASSSRRVDTPVPEREVSTGHVARTALHDADRTFAQYAMTHANTVLFGLLGLILALMFLYVGFWDTVLIAVFVLVGVVIGQAIDGDNGIVTFVRNLFDGIFRH